MFKILAFAGLSLCASASALAQTGQPITVFFKTTALTPTLCGLPGQLISGKYTYRSDAAPTSVSPFIVEYPIDSFIFYVNTDLDQIATQALKVQVGNEIPLSPGATRDRYMASATIRMGLGVPGGDNFLFNAIGIIMEKDAPAPNPALTSFNLPTSAADLAGFTSRLAFLSFQNLITGQFCSVQIPTTVTFGPLNTAPTADPGTAQSIHTGSTVQLNGSNSFDDNTPSAQLAYSWLLKKPSITSTATLLNPNTATPSFVADVAGTYRATLVVTDQQGLQSEPVGVSISSLNQAPTADAGEDKLVATFQTVSLSGAGSTDPDGDALTYSWELTSAPPGSVAVINGPTSATPNFQPDVPGTYTITLLVWDGYGNGKGSDTVDVVAITPTAYVEQNVAGANTVNSQLAPTQVTTAGNQNALGNLLNAAVKAIQKGDKVTAIEKLNAAILRTDGCERNGVPDGAGDSRDWITDCAAQAQMLIFLRASLSALQ